MDEVVMVTLRVRYPAVARARPPITTEREKQAADKLSFVRRSFPDFQGAGRISRPSVSSEKGAERLATTGQDRAIQAELQR